MMKLKNAYKKAKHGAQLYDPRTMEGHIVGMGNGGKKLKYTPAPQGRVYSDNTRVVPTTPKTLPTPQPNITSLLPSTPEKPSYGLLDKPQIKMMKLYSGKEQKPSEYLQSRTYKNPIANAFYKNKGVGIAADLLIDPLNALPTAAFSKFKTIFDPLAIVDNLNEVKKFYNTSKNIVQKADNISDLANLVGMKKGGDILNRPITCSSCGHSWTVSDSGPNPLSCHNCGGVAKMQMGGLQKMVKQRY